MDNSFRVDFIGKSGGLWLLWRTKVGVVTVVESSDQYIHATVKKDAEVVHLIVVYAAPIVNRRSGLWSSLKNVVEEIT